MNIYEKMSAITNEITAVAKNLNVGWGKSSYKAVGEADILAAVKPIEEKYKIYSYPCDREILESAVLTTAKQDGSEAKQQFLRVRTTYRFVDMEKPEDHIDIISYGDGVDSQDKSPGKAMTYADKYALMKAYKIITGDDPDQYYSDDLKGKESKKASSSRYNTPSTPSSGTRSGQNGSGRSQGKQAEQPQQGTLFVNSNHIAALTQEIERTGVTEEAVLGMARVGSMEEITMPVFNALMKKFERTPDRKPAIPPSSDPIPEIPSTEDMGLPFM